MARGFGRKNLQRLQDALGQFPFRYHDRSPDQLRHVEGVEAGLVKRRVLLWQQKRLVEAALLVHVAEERPGEEAVEPLAAEHDPAAIAGPAMPGFGLVAVDVQAAIPAGIQVQRCLLYTSRCV